MLALPAGRTTGNRRSSRRAIRPPREEPNRHRPALGAECPQEDRHSLDVSGVEACPAGSPLDLDAAFTHFFRRCALKKQGKWKGKLGYPRLKTKKKGLGSFRLTGSIVVSEKTIVLPRLRRLRLKEREYLPTGSLSDSLNARCEQTALAPVARLMRNCLRDAGHVPARSRNGTPPRLVLVR